VSRDVVSGVVGLVHYRREKVPCAPGITGRLMLNGNRRLLGERFDALARHVLS
jgi:hypothetical protein